MVKKANTDFEGISARPPSLTFNTENHTYLSKVQATVSRMLLHKPQQYKRAALTNSRDWSVAKPTVPCSSSPSLQETVSRSKFCGRPLLYAVLRWKSKRDAPHKRWTCQCRFDSKVNATLWQRLLEPWTSQKACQLFTRPSYTRAHSPTRHCTECLDQEKDCCLRLFSGLPLF